MSLTNLDALFRPTSVAVLGATPKAASPGLIVMRNLLAGHFVGPVMPVSPDHASVAGVLTYKDVDTLPLTPDLAVLCTPPERTAEYIGQLGRRGTRAAVLLGQGFEALKPELRMELEQELLAEAKKHNLRLLGPGGIGIMVPGAGLNASLAHTDADRGRMAFVTQSDSLFTTVLDWARASSIGFSHVVSMGQQLDVDFAAVLDYLGADPMTKAILLYVESVCQARAFMSAARASARNKPILVMKPGRALPAALLPEDCALEHDEADPVYDVAFRRAGIVRVNSVDDLFDGARTLAKSSPLFADGLAIIANGRSVGLMAADSCLSAPGGGVLAELSQETKDALGSVAEVAGSANPITLRFNASGAAYVKALQAVLKDSAAAAVLVLHVPFAEVDAHEVAQAVAQAAKATKRVVLFCWLGAESDRAARQVFTEAGLPVFETPDKAVAAYLHMVAYRRVQAMLMETPDSLPADFFPDTQAARDTIAQALDDGRAELAEAEARQVLSAYGVPVVESRACTSAKEAVMAASQLGYPVALKIRSPDVEQPYEVGGLALDLETPEQVWDAAAFMVARVHKLLPQAAIEGFTVQQMGRRPGAQELTIGAFVDPVFGPVVRFGHGGIAANLIGDTAVALPPLNMGLAKELISRTRISRLLKGAGDQPPVDLDDLCLTLIQVSQVVIDLPQVVELSINPLFADAQGVLALGAKVRVARTSTRGPDRLAIRPYPKELEEVLNIKVGTTVLLRPIRPEDAQAHFDFVKNLNTEDLRLRFFGAPREFEYEDMASFTQIDYDREMAFIATRERHGGDEGGEGDGERETLGVVRASTKPDNSSAEFAIIVRSDLKGYGLGKALLQKMIRYVKDRGTGVLEASTLPENTHMIALARRLGFHVRTDYEDEVVEMDLPLDEGAGEGSATPSGG